MRILPLLASFTTLLSCTSPDPTGAGDLLNDWKLASGPGGAVMVIREGDVVFEEASGLADVERAIPVTAATNFRLASVTKQFTATAVMILVGREKLSLDQPIRDFFPHLAPAAQPITVRQLLTHSSGILAYEDLIPDTASVPVLDRDVLHLVAPCDSTYFPPGSAYRYSNTGYALLALIVESVSGVTFAEFLEREIFTPLEMAGTVAFERGISSVRNRAFGYSPNPDRPGTFVQTDQSMTSSVLGDGGIYSSLDDLRRWDSALRAGSLLSHAALEEMLTPQVTIEEGTRWYGMGWYVRIAGSDTVTYHGGSTVGFRSCVLRIPARSSAVIVLFNRSDVDTEGIAWKLAERFHLLSTTEGEH
jgi:CubicO group peptidase (beta-lactamase class C family)